MSGSSSSGEHVGAGSLLSAIRGDGVRVLNGDAACRRPVPPAAAPHERHFDIQAARQPRTTTPDPPNLGTSASRCRRPALLREGCHQRGFPRHIRARGPWHGLVRRVNSAASLNGERRFRRRLKSHLADSRGGSARREQGKPKRAHRAAGHARRPSRHRRGHRVTVPALAGHGGSSGGVGAALDRRTCRPGITTRPGPRRTLPGGPGLTSYVARRARLRPQPPRHAPPGQP